MASSGGGAEIDIVAAWEDDTIVLVEVKRRADDDYASPAQAVNRAKQKQIIKAARIFQHLTLLVFQLLD